MANLSEIRKTRLRKLKKIESAGINPYPSASKRTHQIEQVLSD